MNDLQILIEEVARIALENSQMRNAIGHELDASDECLERAAQFLNKQLEEAK